MVGRELKTLNYVGDNIKIQLSNLQFSVFNRSEEITNKRSI
jgi:hypothetical protein